MGAMDDVLVVLEQVLVATVAWGEGSLYQVLQAGVCDLEGVQDAVDVGFNGERFVGTRHPSDQLAAILLVLLRHDCLLVGS